ncbi:hypothetical protein Q4560_13725 [Celeribacter halophilus]|uniref:hypothetical protein n=1 Tax=Celeribacter halophilus TaxID=576117 RepID=UPI0026E2534D|nr:hypothetical protein [Celeribacter halophilus]MDO6724333.1 hypothetical protein [Celeribacter halophilus]
MTRSPSLTTALDALAENLSEGPSGFSAFVPPLQSLIGPCYVAVSLLEPETKLRRIYSSEEDSYPVGSVKSMVGTGWETALVFEGRHLFSPDADALHFAFQDAPAILDLGFGCAINLRIAWEGVLLGSVNLLAKPDAFDAQSFQHAKAFVAPLTLMTLRYIERNGAGL